MRPVGIALPDNVIASFKSSFCFDCQQSYWPLDHLHACGHQISRVDRAVVERIIDVTLRLEGIKRVAIVGRTSRMEVKRRTRRQLVRHAFAGSTGAASRSR